jgi:hypothetical protein
MPSSSWLIGSYPSFQAANITVNAAPTGNEVKTIAAGDYYLYHTTAGLSLMKQLELALEDHTDITTVTVELLKNRKAKITSDTSFTLTWGSSTILRNMLGFAGDLTPAAVSFTATNVSPYHWSPGRTEIALNSPLGVEGARRKDTAVGESGTGVFVATGHNDVRVAEWRWRFCANARVWTSSEAGGEHEVFWHNVLSQYRRFFHWRAVDEDDASGSSASLSTALGPYKMAPHRGLLEYPYAREGEYGMTDARHPVDLSAVKQTEYS